jgi:hypothetical protein
MKLTYENNPSEILDKLLEYHDITILKALLNKKGRKRKTRGNNYIDVSVDVYKLVYLEKYMRERAIDEVAEVRSISGKTIENHLRKFRKLFKYGISTVGGSDKVQTTQMIKELILSKYDWQNEQFYDIDDEKEIEDFVSRGQRKKQLPPKYFPF